MECRDVKKMLSEYIDGVLAEGQVPVVKQHLITCSDCKETYKSMNRLIELMHDMDPVAEPADFRANVRARLERRPSLIGRFRSLVSPPMVKVPLGVAAALIVAFAVTQMPGPDKQTPRDMAVSEELRATEPAPGSPAGGREKKGEAEEEALSKDLARRQPAVELGAVSVGETADRPAERGDSKKESADDETPVVATHRPNAVETPVVGADRPDTDGAVEVDALMDVTTLEQKTTPPSTPVSEAAEPRELLRIVTAVAMAGGTLIETEGEIDGEAEYLIVRLPADSIYSLVRILGEETELIMAPELSAFGLQEKQSETEKMRVPSNRSTATESVGRSRAAIDSIFVRILVK